MKTKPQSTKQSMPQTPELAALLSQVWLQCWGWDVGTSDWDTETIPKTRVLTGQALVFMSCESV